MLYVLIGEDAPGSLDARMAARPAHLARIEALRDEGRLIMAGPLLARDGSDPATAGIFGSMIVAEFETLVEAERWIAGDPYTQQCVFARTSARPYRKVLP